jgi:hypothetical protein
MGLWQKIKNFFSFPKDDSWKDQCGCFGPNKEYKTIRQWEAEGAQFDFDGSEFKSIMSQVTFDPSHLKKFSIEGQLKTPNVRVDDTINLKYTPSEKVQTGVDVFIERTEAKKNAEGYLQFLQGKESIYKARDAGNISQQDFEKAMSKVTAAFFRFKRDNPEAVAAGEDANGKKATSH